MKRDLIISVALLLGGCASQSNLIDCGDPAAIDPDCNPTLQACPARPAGCEQVPAGATTALVEIGSSPTSADIYVDGRYIGRTPLKYPLWFTSRTRYLKLVAKPLHPTQIEQHYPLQVPPLPARITFFMNNAEGQGDAATE